MLDTQPVVFLPSVRYRRWMELPRLVILYPQDKQIWIVEVNTKSNANDLASKLRNKEKQWLEPLRRDLTSVAPHVAEWSMVVKVFIRREAAKSFAHTLGSEPIGAEVYLLEELGFPWDVWGKKLVYA